MVVLFKELVGRREKLGESVPEWVAGRLFVSLSENDT